MTDKSTLKQLREETERAFKNGEPIPIRPDTLKPFKNGWVIPTQDEIHAMLYLAKWTGVDMADRLGVSQRTGRRWTGGQLEIPYSAWAIICKEAGYGNIW